MSASAARQSAMVMGATNGMSVIAWRVMSAHCDSRQHERRERAGAAADQARTSRQTAQIDAIDSSSSGSRSAHSARQSATIWFAGACAHSRPNSFIDSAISQKVSTGLDQNSARSSGEPGHHRLIQSLRSAIWRATSP